LAAVELGKALGAHVVGAVSSPEKAEIAVGAGADEALVYERGPLGKDESRALAGQFKDAGGADGFDLIFDTVGGDYAESAVRSIGWGGRYLVVGFPAGIPCLPLNLALLKGCDICGVFWGAFADRAPQDCADEVAMLFDLWENGRIAPKASHVFPLEKGGEAIARLAARDNVGKIVVSMTG
jgi:NADPH:quinone reductase-like Zn-dependent oxidoreductase